MDIFNSALLVLQDITINKQSFHSALKKFFADGKNNSVTPALLSAFVGCELRHYIVFLQVAEELYPNSNDKCKLAIGLALANSLFLKRVEDGFGFDFVSNVFKDENVDFDKDSFVKFVEAKKDGEPLINPTLDKMSFKFISQRYNVNEWVAKMWTHNFNKNTAYKIARANTKNPIQHLRVNTLIYSKDKLLESYKEELIECEGYNDMLVYTGKDSVRKKKYIIQNRCFQESLALKELVEKLPIDAFKPVAIFSGYYNLLPLELGIKFENQLKIENLTTPNKDFYLFKSNLNRYQIKNVKTIECAVDQLVTAISNPVSLFVLMPENSNFDRLRIDPDYFLSFDRSCLDEIISKQNTLINEASKYIEDDGYLVYAVPTIDKKECQNVVSSFLRKHQDFTLVDEVQHFPYDSSNSTLYYAILKKEKVGE